MKPHRADLFLCLGLCFYFCLVECVTATTRSTTEIAQRRVNQQNNKTSPHEHTMTKVFG